MMMATGIVDEHKFKVIKSINFNSVFIDNISGSAILRQEV